MIFMKNTYGENNPAAGFSLTVFAYTFFESVAYITQKNKAKLFLTKKVTDLQQVQLFNLLDTVPDRVLICSQNPDRHTVEGLYSNRKMNEFFGSDMALSSGDKTESTSVKRSKSLKHHTLMRK